MAFMMLRFTTLRILAVALVGALGLASLPLSAAPTFPALTGRVIDDVGHQSQESIDKIFPTARFAVEASIEQVAVDIGKGHSERP